MAGELGFEPKFSEVRVHFAGLFRLAFFTKWVPTRSFGIKGLGPIYKTRIARHSAHSVAIGSISIFPI